MDDLQFRRAVYEDPNCNDEEVIRAAAEDPSKQQFWDELKKLEANLVKASRVDVPDSLASNLILRQSLQNHHSQKKRSRMHLALAASVAFAFGISVTMWQQPSTINLGEHALAHVHHESDDIAHMAHLDLSLQDVNAKLASFGSQLNGDVGRVYFAEFCDYGGVKSLHLVMEGDQGKVTVFVVPQDTRIEPSEFFADKQLFGQSWAVNKARLVMVAERGQSFNTLKSKLRENMTFAA